MLLSGDLLIYASVLELSTLRDENNWLIYVEEHATDQFNDQQRHVRRQDERKCPDDSVYDDLEQQACGRTVEIIENNDSGSGQQHGAERVHGRCSHGEVHDGGHDRLCNPRLGLWLGGGHWAVVDFKLIVSMNQRSALHQPRGEIVGALVCSLAHPQNLF